MSNQNSFRIYLLSKGFSKTTVESYTQRVSRFLQWLHEMKLPDMSVAYPDMLRYVDSLQSKNIGAHTIQMELSAISQYFQSLQHQGLINSNPASNITLRNLKSRRLHTILTEEQLAMLYQRIETSRMYDKPVPPQELNNLARIRNKVMTGLLAFQGLSVTDLQALTVSDVSIRSGTITVPQTRKYASRILPLQPHQVLDMSEYIQVTRKQLLLQSGKQTESLFFSSGKGVSLHSSFQKLMPKLKQILPEMISLNQIRASVIVHWLGKDGLRKTQYKAGHKYISATEAYQVYRTGSLSENIEKYHPLN